MKIAYISTDDPKDYLSWSGLKLNIYKSLEHLNHDLKIVGPLRNYTRIPFVVKREILKYANIKYDSERKKLLSKIYSKKIENFISNNKVDLIFTSDTYLISYLKTRIPIVIWLDVTYKTYFNHYFNKVIIHKKSFNEANNLEKLALINANKIIVTSKWSKKETIKNYKINSKKIEIIPFGSNLNQYKKFIYKKKSKKINLVSIGVDWDRKGMDKSIEITKTLKNKGINVTLNIIGSKNNSKKLPSYIKQIGFLNKNLKEDHEKILKILSKSDFHILMTKQEACGVVFAEANSCGVFNLTNDVGGVRGMIKNNFNGKLFNPNDHNNKIVNYIIQIFNDKKIFFKLRKNSLDYYKKNLSWQSNAIKLQKILLKTKKY